MEGVLQLEREPVLSEKIIILKIKLGVRSLGKPVFIVSRSNISRLLYVSTAVSELFLSESEMFFSFYARAKEVYVKKAEWKTAHVIARIP